MERKYHKNLIMLAIITMAVIYLAVSVFWIISDIDGGQTTFVISSNPIKLAKADSLLDKLKDLVDKSEKVVVPIEKVLNIKGRVVYTNGNPFVNGLVELRSEPRISYTDDQGYFLYENVEYGQHTISVLDDNNKLLASAIIFIEYNSDLESSRLVQLEDGTWLMEVAVDLNLLEIVLELEQRVPGEGSGSLNLYLKTTTEDEVLDSSVKADEKDQEDTDDPDSPNIDPNIDDNTPKTETPNIEEDNNEEEKTDIPAGSLTVYGDDSKIEDFAKGTAAAAKINIFGNNKKIAPGMSGEYKFTVDNTINNFPIYYDMNFIEKNNKLNIPMKYRLKNHKTNKYVNSDGKSWHTTKEIIAKTANTKKPLTLAAKQKISYSLEWLWEESSHDNIYGEKHGGEVATSLIIEVTAQRK